MTVGPVLSAPSLLLMHIAPSSTHATDAEVRVRDFISRYPNSPVVVHFWAPWCGNSRRELAAWPAFVAAHPDVPVVFVTLWNDGQSGAETLVEHGLTVGATTGDGGGAVREIVQTGDGSKEDAAGRRRHFLGLPVTWIPSTWIFRAGGQLAFACNYGEMDAATLGTLVEATQAAW